MEVQSKRMNYWIFRGIIIAINTNTGFFPIATYNSINVIGGEATQGLSPKRTNQSSQPRASNVAFTPSIPSMAKR